MPLRKSQFLAIDVHIQYLLQIIFYNPVYNVQHLYASCNKQKFS